MVNYSSLIIVIHSGKSWLLANIDLPQQKPCLRIWDEAQIQFSVWVRVAVSVGLLLSPLVVMLKQGRPGLVWLDQHKLACTMSRDEHLGIPGISRRAASAGTWLNLLLFIHKEVIPDEEGGWIPRLY